MYAKADGPPGASLRYFTYSAGFIGQGILAMTDLADPASHKRLRRLIGHIGI
jgi:hypothetical protein